MFPSLVLHLSYSQLFMCHCSLSLSLPPIHIIAHKFVPCTCHLQHFFFFDTCTSINVSFTCFTPVTFSTIHLSLFIIIISSSYTYHHSHNYSLHLSSPALAFFYTCTSINAPFTCFTPVTFFIYLSLFVIITSSTSVISHTPVLYTCTPLLPTKLLHIYNTCHYFSSAEVLF